MHILSAEEETRQMDGQTDNKAGSENKSIYRKQTDRSIDVDTTKSLNWKFEAFEAKPNEHTHTHTYIHSTFLSAHVYMHKAVEVVCRMHAWHRYIHACIHPPASPPTHPRMHARLLASSCGYMFCSLSQTGHVTNACIAALHVDRRFPMSACMEDRRNCGSTQRVRFMHACMHTCRRTNLDRYAGR